jgi:hypothetical protein
MVNMKSINQKIVLLVLGLLTFSLQVFSQEKPFDESILSESGKQAYRKLLKVEFFAMDGIGYGGKASEGKIALYKLLEEGKTKSVLAFKSLVKDANIEGGIYGLIGLKMWRCDCFHEELKNFKTVRTSENNREILRYESGCTEHLKLEKSKDKEEFIDLLVTQRFDIWAR